MPAAIPLIRSRPRVLAMIMAGGKGTRLEPLTSVRSKPAAPFGGKYRIIDFVLSNLVNSGIYSIYVITQFKSQSLSEHLQAAWNLGNVFPWQFVTPVPAQQRKGEHWYLGTADSIYQNLNLIEDRNPQLVAIFGADHIFLMNVDDMVVFALEKDAPVTVACIPVPKEEAHRFGIIQVDSSWRITAFVEKPREDPPTLPDAPHLCLASMGNYIFRTETLRKALVADASTPGSHHDFGNDILPRLLAAGTPLYAYDFRRNAVPNSANGANDSYWRDVGTIEAYYDANLDLRSVTPELDLYNPDWPIRTEPSLRPPPKFVHNVEGRVGQAVQSLVCDGSIISGGSVFDSLVGRDCRINSFSEITQSILMDDVTIGRGAKIHRAIIDKHVTIPEGDRIGFDPDLDRKRFHVSDSGIVVIAKNQKVVKPW